MLIETKAIKERERGELLDHLDKLRSEHHRGLHKQQYRLQKGPQTYY